MSQARLSSLDVCRFRPIIVSTHISSFVILHSAPSPPTLCSTANTGPPALNGDSSFVRFHDTSTNHSITCPPLRLPVNGLRAALWNFDQVRGAFASWGNRSLHLHYPFTTGECWDNIVSCLLALALRDVGRPAGRRQRPGRPTWRPERADDTDSHVETQHK